ncbi:hypothetical protein ZWY2020_036764 [Hordeum vulgare]|nr:hypothetical protein ZWY2020_036764 [Hordeum vulgare]
MFSIFFQYFTRYPLSLAAGQPIKVAPMRLVSNLQQFKSNLERDVTLWGASETLSPRARMLFTMYAQKIMHLARIYQPYGFYGCRFDNANTEALFAEMWRRKAIPLDVRSITWKEYFTNAHPGFEARHEGEGAVPASLRNN